MIGLGFVNFLHPETHGKLLDSSVFVFGENNIFFFLNQG